MRRRLAPLFADYMDVITSTQNRTVRLFRSLAEKKFREREGLFPVEGGNIVMDIPSGQALRFVLATPERAEEAEEGFGGSGVKVYVVADEVMKSVSDTVTPYGLAAAAELPHREFAAPQGDALLLDGVSDPGNLGTILRTAAATGFGDVYLLDCADAYAPKTVRASMGGIFRVRTYDVTEEQAKALAAGTASAVLDMGGRSLTGSPLPTPCLYVAGSEAHGVRAALRGAAREIRSLPMAGGMESLNVAVACAVAMYLTFSLGNGH
mgnify:CR=1 FL=1